LRQPTSAALNLVTKNVHLYLIKPSQYDDDGYVVRHWRGVLPSNTLACLAGLTQDLIDRKALGASTQIKMHLVDEAVERVPVRRICRSQRVPHTKTIVCLVGVQTNQFPRATDLALQFGQAGLTVMMGGFHVSGYLALRPDLPAEIQELISAGVTIVKGEVEETWGDLLRDAITGKLKPLYDFLSNKPDLFDKPVPLISKRYLRRFVARNFGTLDCGRGCPFDCSFCTVINVQGRKMRFRSAERIAAAVRRNFQVHGVTFYFFTDDNFARNRNWEAIFDALSCLREIENIPVEFMMQVDTLSWRIPNFVEKAARAGCQTVFIGVESLNPENLKAAGKRQNRVDEYHSLIEAYRRLNISTHVAYIIGFPCDTPDSVRQDITCLIEQVRPDHASFFMLTPLPGSYDHLRMLRLREWMHPDFNLYDSHHEVTVHPHMKNGLWKENYVEAWRRFYSLENMKAVLRRSASRAYWNNLLRFLWYRNSMETEGRHPMMCGFVRLKARRDRRPGYPLPTRWQYMKVRARELRAQLAASIRVLLEMQEVWLQTRHPSAAEQFVAEELHRIQMAARGRLRLADEQLAHLRAKVRFPALHVPSKIQLLWAKWYPLLAPSRVYTRADLDCFWRATWQHWKQRQWFRIQPHRVAFNMFRDAQLLLMFFFHMARAQ